MGKRLSLCFLMTAAGIALLLIVLWPDVTTPAQADSSVYCVNSTGTGCNAVCGGGCFASVQAAINAAPSGGEIRIAGGTYTATGGTVAVITKPLALIGGYAPDFGSPNPDPTTYQTVLDAQWGGSVISITNAVEVLLMHLTLTHGDGSDNCGSGYGCGGGIYAKNTSLHIGNCVITNNVANRTGNRRGLGGGIYAFLPPVIEIWSSQILSNTANTSASTLSPPSKGGGLCVLAGSAVILESQIRDNVGSVAGGPGYGGGILLENLDSCQVMSNTISGNRAATVRSGSSGGGLYLWSVRKCDVTANRIENNWTNPNWAGDGGGILIHDSEVRLDRNVIISNTALPPGSAWAVYGGGVSISTDRPVTLTNNLITHNTASSNGGGGVYVRRFTPPFGRALLVNNTIADNGHSGVAASMYVTLVLTNNIIAGHTTGLTVTPPFTGAVAADHNLFWNTTDPITGSNAILKDPLLGVDYRPRPGSPAIDAGATIPWLTVDLAGNHRPQGSGYDIGAFEGVGYEVFLPLVLRNR